MFQIIRDGAFLGILLSIMIGPALFMLLETSLKHGFKRALFLDLGIVLSDFIYLLAAYFFAEQIQHALKEYEFLKYVGGSLFIAGGFFMIFRRNNIPSNQEVDVAVKQPGVLPFFIKGMALNAINPFVLIFWIAAFSYALDHHQLTFYSASYYFGATLGTMFAIDVLKIYFAYKVKKYLSDMVIKRIGVVVGAILIFFGIAFFFRDMIVQ
jgi:threonine/homoserine/homoserine lactone efflux protein